jgi:hypothetical protein
MFMTSSKFLSFYIRKNLNESTVISSSSFFLFPSKVEKPYISEFIYKHFPDPNYTFHNIKKQSPSRNTTFFKLILTTLTPHDSAVHDFKMESCKIEDELVFVTFL